MSVYIKNMEMPKSCCECFAFKSNADGYLFCKAKRIAFGKEDAEWLPLKTPNWCPLSPVPPHGMLIDADALCKTLRSLAENEYTTKVFANWIENHIDTIIPADDKLFGNSEQLAKEGET